MKKKGFTLIELLVVVAIIGVLVTMVLGAVGKARGSARDAKRHSDIRTIKTQLEIYYLDNGYYPNSGWRHSSSDSQWASFQAQLGDLPVDPVNDGALTTSGASPGYTYSYYGSGFGCSGQWYMLTYRLESDPSPESSGVNRCDSASKFNYAGTITTGVNIIEG